MKRMWSVRTKPKRVFTVVPSTIGRMSRWTPSRETSGPWPDSRPAILSISSRKIIPEDSTRSSAARATVSMSIRRSLFSHQVFHRFIDAHFAPLAAPLKQIAEHVLHVNAHLFDAHWPGKFNRRKVLFAHFHLDQTVV